MINSNMKRSLPSDAQIDITLSDSSDSEAEAKRKCHANEPTHIAAKHLHRERTMSEDYVLIKRAEMYQDYMRQLPIPTHRGSVIPFTSWMGLGRSIKQLYGQPLHYLTNVLLKQWDQLRIGSEDEVIPLDTIIHPCKAEATIWIIEEVHRRTASPDHVAKLWLLDPMHRAFVDSIFPSLESPS